MREFDLPPFWDGRPVVWDGWRTDRDLILLCPVVPPECCPACGSLQSPVANRGRLATSALVTHERIAEATAARNRLPFDLRHKIRPLAYYELVAHRCMDCLHDQVSELGPGGATWDLDATDYGPEGSWPDAESSPAS